MPSESVSFPAPVDPPAVPPSPQHLERDGVHLWHASLDGGSDGSLLSPEEAARADRALTPARRARFVRSRALLRTVLAGYAGAEPAALRFGEGPEGKPFLRRPAGDLAFNLSHAGSLWVLAVARGRSVGIDVENVTRKVDLEGVAKRVFSEAEARTLAGVAVADRRRAFFRCWAAREAVVKGLGTGMLTPSVTFEIEADPSRPVGVHATGEDSFPWWLRTYPVPDDHVGVLAVEGAPARVSSFTLHDTLAGR